MPGRKRVKGSMKPLRVKVEPGTKGAFLWASFGDHMKGGLASLLPIVVLSLVASAGFVGGSPSFSDRVFSAVNGFGQTVATFGWTLIAVGAAFCAGWAGMSIGLVHLMRYRSSFLAHLAVHAVAGAVFLTLLSVGLLSLSQRDELAGAPVWESEYFPPLALGSLGVGAAGSALGLWALKGLLYWYVLVEREPLKDVFTFVEGHRSKNDFERL